MWKWVQTMKWYGGSPVRNNFSGYCSLHTYLSKNMKMSEVFWFEYRSDTLSNIFTENSTLKLQATLHTKINHIWVKMQFFISTCRSCAICRWVWVSAEAHFPLPLPRPHLHHPPVMMWCVLMVAAVVMCCSLVDNWGTYVTVLFIMLACCVKKVGTNICVITH